MRRLLEAATDVEIVGEVRTGREAVAAIKRAQPHVVFLDIQMPGLDGFGVLDAIQSDETPYVVFVTADESKALKAFEAGAVDYLLKPFTPERFGQVLDRARSRMSNPVEIAPTSFLERILVIEDGRATFVTVNHIDWIESDRNYVVLHVGGQEHRLRATIAAVADRLDPAHFLRINRSTLVRLDAVASMNEWSHGDYKVTLRDGSELTWTRRFRGDAERRFGVDS